MRTVSFDLRLENGSNFYGGTTRRDFIPVVAYLFTRLVEETPGGRVINEISLGHVHRHARSLFLVGVRSVSLLLYFTTLFPARKSKRTRL